MDIIHKKNPITDFITHKKDFHTISPLEDKKFSKSFYKSFILDILSLFFAFVFGFYFFNYLNNKTNFLIFLISGILFLTIIIFETLLNLNWSRRFLIIFLETILLFYFFFQKEIINIILVLFLTFLVLRLWGEFQTRRELENCLEIRLLKLIKPTFSSFISAIILVIICFYILNFEENNIFISKLIFDNFWKNFVLFYNKIYNDIKFDGSLDDFIKSIVIKDIKKNFAFKNFSKKDYELVLNDLIVKNRENFLNFFNLKNIDTNQSLGDIIYFSFENKLRDLYNKFGVYFIIIWGIIIFWFWYSIISFLKIFLNIWFFIIFEIFIATGFIKILGENRTKEILTF